MCPHLPCTSSTNKLYESQGIIYTTHTVCKNKDIPLTCHMCTVHTQSWTHVDITHLLFKTSFIVLVLTQEHYNMLVIGKAVDGRENVQYLKEPQLGPIQLTGVSLTFRSSVENSTQPVVNYYVGGITKFLTIYRTTKVNKHL